MGWNAPTTFIYNSNEEDSWVGAIHLKDVVCRSCLRQKKAFLGRVSEILPPSR